MNTQDRAEKARQELRTPAAAGVAGIVFAVLFATSLLLTRAPQDASPESFAKWYSGGIQSTLVLVGLYAIPFAGIAFLWFIGVIRDRVGSREDRLFATVFLGSGLLFVSMLFSAAASGSAIALRMDAFGWSAPQSAELLRFAQALTYAFMYVYAARAAGVFVLVTSTIVWRTESMPRWIAATGYAVAALLLLSIRDFQLVIMLFPLWVALLSVAILVTSRSAGPEEAPPDDAGSG